MGKTRNALESLIVKRELNRSVGVDGRIIVQGDTKKTGTFEMRSDSERMLTWRRTPSTGRNFQT